MAYNKKGACSVIAITVYRPNPGEGIIEVQEEKSWQKKYTVFYSRDKKFPMAGRTYQVVAENFFFSENLLLLNDFMGLVGI